MSNKDGNEVISLKRVLSSVEGTEKTVCGCFTANANFLGDR